MSILINFLSIGNEKKINKPFLNFLSIKKGEAMFKTKKVPKTSSVSLKKAKRLLFNLLIVPVHNIHQNCTEPHLQKSSCQEF